MAEDRFAYAATQRIFRKKITYRAGNAHTAWYRLSGYWLSAIGYPAIGYPAIGYWLLAIGYWLLAIGYWQLAACMLSRLPRAGCFVYVGSFLRITMANNDSPLEKLLERSIFASRWLQAPLYVGLIVAQGIYVYQFFVELWHLLHSAITGNFDRSIAPDLSTFTMLMVLGLIDVVMIANLLIMVIIGGYETFVSKLHLDDHADQPEWLSHVNAGVLKVKLATALISISSIHLLKTFITVMTPAAVNHDAVKWQIVIHIVFVFSAIALAWTDKLMMAGVRAQHPNSH